ncbi:MAG: class I SAM-dependent methyltransferase [Anaerolineales bacterium]|jgi:SAM-dependent methyltransferase
MSIPPGFARLYDAQYHDFQDDLNFWLELVRRAGDPALEIGCGTGRVLTPLIRAGFHVVGVDRDRQMLAVARDRLRSAGSGACDLIQADLTEFEAPNRFRSIMAPLNTLATLDDEAFQAALLRSARNLVPGAELVCDFPNPATSLEEQADPDEVLDTFFEPVEGHAVQVRATVGSDQENTAQHVTWVYDLLGPRGEMERFLYNETYYLRGLEELRALAQPAGMRLALAIGEYDGSAYAETSSRLIAIFRRDQR